MVVQGARGGSPRLLGQPAGLVLGACLKMKQHVAHVASEFAFIAFALALVSAVAAFPVELCCPRLGAGAFGRA